MAESNGRCRLLRHVGANQPALEFARCAAILTAVQDDSGVLGELQAQIMAALWRLGAGTVEQVRAELPSRYRGAYNTVQTVLVRLTDRGLLTRTKVRNAFEYTPRITEDEYLSRSIARALAGASTDARQVALARLIGTLDHDELSDLQRLAGEIGEKRRRR